jgi:5-methylcytosine-specific restriction endonuclease McrA
MAEEIITRAEARAKGLKRYFSGEPCGNGHIAERFVCNSMCCECGKLRQRTESWSGRKTGLRDQAIESDQVTYFTGRPCSRGHISSRYVANKTCVDCQAEDRAQNRDLINSRSKEYYKRARDSRLAWGRAYRQSEIGRKKRREYFKSYLQSEMGRKKRREYLKSYHRLNSDKIAVKTRRWAKENPDKIRATWVNRRARVKGAEGSHTAADLKAILAAQSHKCAYCRLDLRKAKRHLDHIRALARGGTNDRTNLQYLCAGCNLSKGAKDEIAFAQERGLLL